MHEPLTLQPTVPAASVVPTFDSASPYRLHPTVGLRPESFGALAYHFDTRRLVFLRSRVLVDLVGALAQHSSAEAAIDAVVGSSRAQRRSYMSALASLVDSGVIEPVAGPVVERQDTGHGR